MNEKICPECKNTMDTKDVNGIQIDTCATCNGIFFDFNELGHIVSFAKFTGEKFTNILKGDDKVDHPEISYICTNCGNKMIEKEYCYDSGIHIDFCENCKSVYLNKNEIDEINKFLASQDSIEGKVMEDKGLEIIEQYKISQEEIERNENQKQGIFWLSRLTRFILDIV